MALEDDIGLLDRLPTLHALGLDALRILAISSEQVRLEDGEVLFEEGERADGGYVVIAGAVQLQSSRDRSDEDILLARPGALIGETALVVDTARPATAIAVEPTAVLKIARSTFLRVLEGEPQAADALRKVIAQRVEAALNDLDLALPLFAGEGSGGPRAP
ncbi:MAG TPA: Crp/Fnr family transcriptional regulator [Xanthobacteraceae bacterium]|jgi:CRP-like cAMP-binding protein|nr:Crp/Fnr family transcriptional regulator [Xanthobacteraceae bacterium]